MSINEYRTRINTRQILCTGNSQSAPNFLFRSILWRALPFSADIASRKAGSTREKSAREKLRNRSGLFRSSITSEAFVT